jgi:hypothetical protein
VLSRDPFIALVPNFTSPAECAYMQQQVTALSRTARLSNGSSLDRLSMTAFSGSLERLSRALSNGSLGLSRTALSDGSL